MLKKLLFLVEDLDLSSCETNYIEMIAGTNNVLCFFASAIMPEIKILMLCRFGENISLKAEMYSFSKHLIFFINKFSYFISFLMIG